MTITVPVLNEEQQVASDFIINYVTSKDRTYKMVALIGFAGTGKTFTLSHIVKELNNISRNADVFTTNFKIAMSAPTHKAVRVMKKFSNSMPEVTFATVHSLLGLEEKIGNDGKISYIQSKDPTRHKIEQYNVLFLDEVSMLQDELFMLLQQYVNNGRLKLVFIGDAKQIPPIGKIDSIPLLESSREKYGIGTIVLDKIMRQAQDNPILSYATRIRKASPGVGEFPILEKIVVDGVGGVVPIRADDEATINQLVEEYFDCEAFKQDADHMKIIAWRNVTVDAYNKIVRKHIYKQHPGLLPFIMPNEKMIIDKPVVMTNGKILLTSNEEIVVQEYQERQYEVRYMTAERHSNSWEMVTKNKTLGFYDTMVIHYDEDGVEQPVNIRILHDGGQKVMDVILKEISDAAKGVEFNSPFRNKLWQSFFTNQRLFAAVKYNYALTAHKSQGSSYDYCLMVDWDINMNKNVAERNRIRYVGATRARKILYIVQ